MKVFALVGKSGTGKSFQAMNICNKLHIDAIIDDGLFIYNHQVVCGTSAKREKTKIGAVKTALFSKKEHAQITKEKIKEKDPQSILILGTSKGMVERIAKSLELPPIEDYIMIEEITSQEERKTAYKQRFQLGKHVIPAATIQVKKDFAGYFIHPILRFKDAASKVVESRVGEDRTVVRPTYSYLGNYFISNIAVKDIVRGVARRTKGISKVFSIHENANSEAMAIKVEIESEMGEKFWDIIFDFQQGIKTQIEEMTAFNVVDIDIEVKSVVY